MKTWFWALIILIILIIAGVFLWLFAFRDQTTIQETSSGQKVSIPQKVLDNKFGWLGGGAEDDGSGISDAGGAWVRPHPGAFLWDAMQMSANGNIDFTQTDKEIANYQKNNLGILVTLWPFADWDQKTLSNANDCRVESNDEFLPKNDKKGRGSYLPEYRCNPSDWSAYNKWVEVIVERYDGDGISDMTGLKMPVKYWEVLNEPDLNYEQTKPISETHSLNFYKQGPLDYGELLKQTYAAIKTSDQDSQVLIAGAAGGGSFLNFYSLLFEKMADTPNYFDIGNIHCISNDQQAHDFNVGEYKSMLEKYGITKKPIWVTEAEAFYRENKSADENYQTTKTSVAGAIAAGAERIFFTRYSFDDFRTDMSEKTDKSAEKYPNAEKYRDIIKNY